MRPTASVCLISATLAACLGANVAAGAAPQLACTVESGPRTAALLELYTSEGCSSCPPADKWLAGLGRRDFAHGRVVPLALHVDYWNYIGWVDPYAQRTFTDRQYAYARRGGGTTVYTPQFFLNGIEYRSWYRDDLSRRLQGVAGDPPQASLRLTASLKGDAGLHIAGEARLREPESAKHSVVYVALYENNLSNEIDAGENEGKTLHHDFVARRLLGPIDVGARGAAAIDITVPVEREWKRRDLGVVAFVQRRDTGAVLQALALQPCL